MKSLKSLHVTPNPVIFENIDVGESRTIDLFVRNASKKPLIIRFSIPISSPFKLTQTKSTVTAPGLGVHCSLQFTCKKLEIIKSMLKVQCENFIEEVPILVYPPAASISVQPPSIDLGTIALRSSTKSKITLKNTGPKQSEFKVDPDNFYYTSNDGMLYSKDNLTLISCPCNKQTQISFHSSITKFVNEAFRGGQMTYSLTIPDSITEIPGSCFSESHFNTIILPNKLIKIMQYSFQYTKLKEIIIPKTVKLIDSYAFFKSKIQKIVFQIHMQKISIKNYAFGNCTYLTYLELPQKGVDFESSLVFSSSTNIVKVIYLVEELPNFKQIFNRDDIKHYAKIRASTQTKEIQTCGTIKVSIYENFCSLHHITCKKIRKDFLLSVFHTIIILQSN